MKAYDLVLIGGGIVGDEGARDVRFGLGSETVTARYVVAFGGT